MNDFFFGNIFNLFDISKLMEFMKVLAVLTLVLVTSLALDPKKGVGCPDSCNNITLQNLGVSWYYNWNNYTN